MLAGSWVIGGLVSWLVGRLGGGNIGGRRRGSRCRLSLGIHGRVFSLLVEETGVRSGLCRSVHLAIPDGDKDNHGLDFDLGLGDHAAPVDGCGGGKGGAEQRSEDVGGLHFDVVIRGRRWVCWVAKCACSGSRNERWYEGSVSRNVHRER